MTANDIPCRESDQLRREIRRLIKLGGNMLSMIEEYHQCEWEEEPFTPDIEDMKAKLKSPLCCPLCKGSETTDGALGFNGEGPCPRCLPEKWGQNVRMSDAPLQPSDLPSACKPQ